MPVILHHGNVNTPGCAMEVADDGRVRNLARGDGLLFAATFGAELGLCLRAVIFAVCRGNRRIMYGI
jgi:hypothetical protein